MITPAYLRERAAYYLKLAETDEMRDHAETLRTLARAFEAEAKALEERGAGWMPPSTTSPPSGPDKSD